MTYHFVINVNKPLLALTQSHVGPCHDGMERPWVADGGDGLQIWRAAVKKLNKQ